MINDNVDNQCFQSLVFFSSDHIGNLTVELILASAEVIFKNGIYVPAVLTNTWTVNNINTL